MEHLRLQGGYLARAGIATGRVIISELRPGHIGASLLQIVLLHPGAIPKSQQFQELV